MDEQIDHLFSKVLLIEDEDAHAFLVTRSLKNMVGEIERATTISQALEFIKTKQYDLIVSDLQLPDSSGVKGVKQVTDLAKNIPVIVLTSSRSLADAVQAMRNGAKDYLVKEFDSNFQEVLHFSLTRLFTSYKLEQEQIRLRKETEILRVAIENSTDSMAIVDRKGNVNYANKTFLSFAKKCTERTENIYNIFTDKLEKHTEIKSLFEKNLNELEKGAAWHTELNFQKDRENAYDFALSVVAKHELNRDYDACVVWLRDISELKRREKFQREILSTTTHDLKGPLGAISLSAELITELTSIEDKTHQLALRIGSSARGAINLIDEFLSARRIQEGTFILKPVTSKVKDLFEELQQSYSALAKPKAIELCVELDAELTAVVDRLGFQRTIGNLLSNAIKFTDKNGKVYLRAYNKGTQFYVEVEDTGSGMEPADLKKIFERFGRLDKHSAIAGSGLGLFVVKSIVKAHGGNIDVISQVGKGTKFILTFPHNPPVNERGELISLDFN